MRTAAPSWDDLHEIANGQAGHFTAQQAAEAGFSAQLLSKHVKSGNLERPMRGIYRITRYPPAEHEGLVVLWLWSDREAVFCHETALSLHGLSDALPAKVHLTLPSTTPQRKKIPEGVVAHLADMPAEHRQWLGPVPIATPARAVLEVADAHGDAALVARAIDQGIRSGTFTFEQVARAGRYVANAQGVTTSVRPAGDLGDRFYARQISGTCATPPPADWPTIAEDLGHEVGAYLRVAQYLPPRTMFLEFAWRVEQVPEEAAVNALRRRLAKRFSWA